MDNCSNAGMGHPKGMDVGRAIVVGFAILSIGIVVSSILTSVLPTNGRYEGSPLSPFFILDTKTGKVYEISTTEGTP